MDNIIDICELVPVVSDSVDYDSLRKPPLLICQTLAHILQRRTYE